MPLAEQARAVCTDSTATLSRRDAVHQPEWQWSADDLSLLADTREGGTSLSAVQSAVVLSDRRCRSSRGYAVLRSSALSGEVIAQKRSLAFGLPPSGILQAGAR